MTYADTKQAVRASLLAGGFSYTQADAVVTALGAMLQQFFAQELAAVAAASQAAILKPPT